MAVIGLIAAVCAVSFSGAYAASDEPQSFVSDVEYASPPAMMEYSKEIFIDAGEVYSFKMLEFDDDKNHPYRPAKLAGEKRFGAGQTALTPGGGIAQEFAQITAGYTGKNSEVGWLRYR